MIRTFTIGLAAAAALAPAMLAAQTAPAPQPPHVPARVTAKTLTDVCAQERSACLTYVLGALDAFAAALVASGRPQVFCIPKGTINDKVAESVVAYLRAHPEEAKTNAALVVLAGLKSKYPCGY